MFDRAIQAVYALALVAVAETLADPNSYGFRKERAVADAIAQCFKVLAKKNQATWILKVDIQKFFDSISHEWVLEHIHLPHHVLEKWLKSGVLESGKLQETTEGTPQGGIASPLLANIVLNELDAYVEDVLIPKYPKGKKRKANPEYERLSAKARRAKKNGNWETANELRKEYTKIPSKMSQDENFRRLWYVRYADDTLFGLIGTKAEAEAIREDFRQFLSTIKLEMSEKKTLITHALSEKARFLNYEVNYMEENSEVRMRKDGVKARTVNGGLWFGIPKDVIKTWKAKVQRVSKTTHRSELLNMSDDDIISTYEIQLQGLINSYNRAHNVKKRTKFLRHVWEESLAKTLAAKHKSKVTTIYRKYQRFVTSDERKILGVEIQRKEKKPLIAVFGKKPIQRSTGTTMVDDTQTLYVKRNELLTRMLAETCELCGSQQHVEAHHIRKLADLRKYKENPQWMQKMIAIRRKTLFVCQKCHTKIHNGTYDGTALAKVDWRAT
jgi:group II intron reverse transcriptase/maturase